ncbi:MAG: AAA family ATPase [Spirochaetaceae bacterium]|nr:AAA family ATPase [Spirochaetaceae bacterium]
MALGKWNNLHEALIKDWEENLVRTAISNGYDVIVDDTNLNLNTCERWKKVSIYLDCKIEFKFIATALDECIRRDKQRPDPVGENVIRKLYDKYLKL